MKLFAKAIDKFKQLLLRGRKGETTPSEVNTAPMEVESPPRLDEPTTTLTTVETQLPTIETSKVTINIGKVADADSKTPSGGTRIPKPVLQEGKAYCPRCANKLHPEIWRAWITLECLCGYEWLVYRKG
jgi:hypothetical protein